jgi:hypothetical protein
MTDKEKEKVIEEATIQLDQRLAALEADLARVGDVAAAAVQRQTDSNAMCRMLADWSSRLNREASRFKYRDAARYRRYKDARNKAKFWRGKLIRARIREIPAQLDESHARFLAAGASIDSITRGVELEIEDLDTFARRVNYAARIASAIWVIIAALAD